MITLIEGRIGSGKTFFAVRQVLLDYFKFDEDKVAWIPRDDVEVAVYSNVDGFHVAGDLDTEIKKAGGIDTFFSPVYQKKFTKLKRHVYVIDEAQKSQYFHRKYYNPEVFEVFEMSRHFGIEFILITQDIWKMSPGLTGLPELHIKVQRRSLCLFGSSFVYMYMSDKDIIKKKSLKKDPRVFFAYRSQRVLEKFSVSSFSRRYAGFFILALGLCVVGFFVFVKSFSLGGSKKVVSVTSVDVVKASPVAVVGGKSFYRKGSRVASE